MHSPMCYADQPMKLELCSCIMHVNFLHIVKERNWAHGLDKVVMGNV